MSLVNDMLRDLDSRKRRHDDHAVRVNNKVTGRPQPRASATSRLLIGIAIIVGVVMGMAAGYLLFNRNKVDAQVQAAAVSPAAAATSSTVLDSMTSPATTQ